jgi:hypothetical protein
VSPDASVAQAVAKYFFLSCLDVQKAFSASLKVLADLHANNWMDEKHRSEWVRALHRGRHRLKVLSNPRWSEVQGIDGFLIPSSLDLGIWSSFLTTAHPEECEAVLLSRILKFSDVEIASGIGVSEGTIRYRVGRGLRHLGGYVES